MVKNEGKRPNARRDGCIAAASRGGGGSTLLSSRHHLPRPAPLFPHSDEARRNHTYFEKTGVRSVARPRQASPHGGTFSPAGTRGDAVSTRSGAASTPSVAGSTPSVAASTEGRGGAKRGPEIGSTDGERNLGRGRRGGKRIVYVPVELVEVWTRPPETGAAYHGGVGTRGTRMSRGHTLDTRPVPSASKRMFDRGGCHRRTWRQVYAAKSLFYTRIWQN